MVSMVSMVNTGSMMEGPPIYFVVGLIACFIGTIPFGPINLTVVKTTVDYNQARGTEVALAASIFHFGEFTIQEAKRHLACSGVEVRL